jgi:hypothetical protein
MHSIQLRFLTLLLAAMLCAACGKGSSGDAARVSESSKSQPVSGPVDAASADETSVQEAEKQTSEMVRGVSPGKPSAPVELKFNVAARPALGVPLDIDLAVIATAGTDSMTLSVQASEGIEVDATTSLASFPKSQPGALYRHKLRITPRAEGAFNVSVLITMVVPGSGPQSRSFSIPLLVGNVAALEKAGTAQISTDSSGERVTSAPAVETTH